MLQLLKIAPVLITTYAAMVITTVAQGASRSHASSGVTSELVIYLILLIAFLFLYVLPTFIAFYRRHPNRWPIMMINVLFGATGLGWFGSLIWAMSAVHRSPNGSHGGESGLNLFVNDPQLVRVEPQTRSQAPASAPVDPVEQLAQLKRLFDAGAISAEEHASLRKSVLDTLVG